MKKKIVSQEHIDNVSHSLHRNTIALALVILILGIMVLPWSDPSSAAFVPLILSMIVSIIALVLAGVSLKKQVKKEMQRKAEMGPFAHIINSDVQESVSEETDVK